MQDRRGHRPPPWGFFGGGIEAGETPLQAVLREAREELDLDLAGETQKYEGELTSQHRDLRFTLHLFLWVFAGDVSALTVYEGAELVTPRALLEHTEPGGPDDLHSA